MKTARERAERALRHAPIMPIAKEAVLVFVEQEIIGAVEEALKSRDAIAFVNALDPDRRAIHGPRE